MRRSILSSMGRTSKKLRTSSLSSSSLNAHNLNQSRAHPYFQSSHALLVSSTSQKIYPMVVSTSTEQPLATIDKTTPIAGTTSYSNSTLHPQYISPGKSWPESQPFPVATPSGNKLSLNSSKCISDDCWSPFDNPSVQQCLAARLQPALSLLESRHQTPMYVPDQSSSFATRSRGPRDPSLVATTYAGYAQPMERITLSILDIESGEFLRQFPFR